MSPAPVLILTVNYRGADETIKLLATLRNLDGFSLMDVVVVDNGSGDDSWSKISAAISSDRNVRVLASAENRGYFGAARWGLQQHLADRHGLPPWIIVCNHDILIADKKFVARLLEQEAPAVGVIAPRIRALETGMDQNPFLTSRPSRWHWASLRLISSCYGFAAAWDWLSRHKRLFGNGSRERHDTVRRAIYAPHGSFFIFSRQYFDAGGYLDGNLFLFGEEISVAEICRSLNLKIVYEPSLCVLHNEHASTGKKINRFTYEWQRQALDYLGRQYFSGVKSTAASGQPGGLS